MRAAIIVRGRRWLSAATTLPVRIRRSPRVLAVSLLVDASPALALGLLLWTIASALAPVLLVVATGRLVAAVPAAIRAGATGAEEGRLTAALVTVGILYVATVVLGPIYDGLRSVSRARLTFALQKRLLAAVGGPVGVEHLEDPRTLNQIAGAQGALTSYFPSDAPVALAAVASYRATGLIACGVVAYYWWWLGLGLTLLWLSLRRPLQRILLAYIAAYGGEASMMRRANYLIEVPTGLAAAKEVRIFGLPVWLLEQFRRNWHLGMQSSWETLSRYRRTVAALELVVVPTYAFATWVVADAAQSREIGIAAFVLLLPMLILAANIGMMTMDDVQLEWMLASLPNLSDLEDSLLAEQVSLAGTRAVDRLPQRAVQFEAVRFSYPGSDRPVFTALDITLAAGRSTAIVGPNGVGKTTLVKLLCRLHDPTGGRITVDGVPLTAFDAGSWRRNTAVVYQDFNRYPLSLADNIGFGSPSHLDDTSAIRYAAERAGLLPLVDSLPNGLSTTLSSRYRGGVDLSGGQWQRVSLARALFAVDHGARLLVLDEPTASLDVRGEAEFYERFLELTAGVTTLLISHRFASVRHTDMIYVLEDGLVSEGGSHDELMAQRGTYSRLFAMQASRFATISTSGEPMRNRRPLAATRRTGGRRVF